jgi:Zn-dependent M28 family amino/carboxypeptidase
MKRLLTPLVVTITFIGGACTGSANNVAPEAQDLSRSLQAAVTIEGINEHLEALQAIADESNGTRASGTRGYDESANYVAEQLRDVGYEVELQEFEFPFWFEDSKPRLTLRRRDQSFTEGDDFVTMFYSGSGAVDAPLTPVDLSLEAPGTSGCDSADYASFVPGTIAVVTRGGCFYRVQATLAQQNGASAILIVQNKEESGSGVLRGTLTPDSAIDIPVLGVAYKVGKVLLRAGATGSEVRIDVDAVKEERTTANVIAETSYGDDSNVIVLGGHLDSVPGGPGINDNGSGVATILEVAQEMADFETPTRVRFAFWGGEEYGLLGSFHYVFSLDGDELDAINAYLNFDMLGSPNFVRFVYEGRQLGSADEEGSVEIQEIFEQHFGEDGEPTELIPLENRSDHAAFAGSGIAVEGLFSGADDVKSSEEVRAYGGRAGELHDPCYHLPCDTIDNVDLEVLDDMADAVANAVAILATSS